MPILVWVLLPLAFGAGIYAAGKGVQSMEQSAPSAGAGLLIGAVAVYIAVSAYKDA